MNMSQSGTASHRASQSLQHSTTTLPSLSSTKKLPIISLQSKAAATHKTPLMPIWTTPLPSSPRSTIVRAYFADLINPPVSLITESGLQLFNSSYSGSRTSESAGSAAIPHTSMRWSVEGQYSEREGWDRPPWLIEWTVLTYNCVTHLGDEQGGGQEAAMTWNAPSSTANPHGRRA
jgi:hypothetical protein